MKRMKIVKGMEGVKEAVKKKGGGAKFRQPTCESESESDGRNERGCVSRETLSQKIHLRSDVSRETLVGRNSFTKLCCVNW